MTVQSPTKKASMFVNLSGKRLQNCSRVLPPFRTAVALRTERQPRGYSRAGSRQPTSRRSGSVSYRPPANAWGSQRQGHCSDNGMPHR